MRTAEKIELEAEIANAQKEVCDAEIAHLENEMDEFLQSPTESDLMCARVRLLRLQSVAFHRQWVSLMEELSELD